MKLKCCAEIARQRRITWQMSYAVPASAAIRFDTGEYPGMQVDRLLTDTVSPVCSPEPMKGKRPLRHPRDLRHHALRLLAEVSNMRPSSKRRRMKNG